MRRRNWNAGLEIVCCAGLAVAITGCDTSGLADATAPEPSLDAAWTLSTTPVEWTLIDQNYDTDQLGHFPEPWIYNTHCPGFPPPIHGVTDAMSVSPPNSFRLASDCGGLSASVYFDVPMCARPIDGARWVFNRAASPGGGFMVLHGMGGLTWWPDGNLLSRVATPDEVDIGDWFPGVFLKAEMIWDVNAGSYQIFLDDVLSATESRFFADPFRIETGTGAEFFDDDHLFSISYTPKDLNSDGLDDCSPGRATDAIDDLDQIVTALVGAGDLNPGPGNGLTKKLDQALKQLDRGRVQQARQALSAFQDQVVDLVADGDLSAAEGQSLIDGAQAIIEELTP